MNTVKLTNVTKIIKKRTILSNLNLTLEKGNIYGLYGRNGSGKTMLIRIISGLILPSSGTVEVFGQRIGKDISFPQSMGLTIENVGFAPAYRQFDTALILTNQETGESRRMKTEIDNRSIAGSDQSEFQIELDVRSFAKGTYQVNLEMKDPYTRQVIHFANTGSEESATVSVGRLVIP